MTKDQRLHREPDPRVRRSLVVAFATSALLVAGALTVVGVRVEQVHLAYRLDAVRSERGRAEDRIRQLEIEVVTLRSTCRIEARVRALGFVVAVLYQVWHAKDYVACVPSLVAEWRRDEVHTD